MSPLWLLLTRMAPRFPKTLIIPKMVEFCQVEFCQTMPLDLRKGSWTSAQYVWSGDLGFFQDDSTQAAEMLEKDNH